MGEFEACLSDPWYSRSPLVRTRNVAFVARPYTIGISYTDGYGKYQETELSGWHAQVLQLLNDGGYWGPEAESHIAPEDLNIEALKVQMKLFLKRYGEDIDPNDVSSDSFKDLVARVMNEKRGKPAGGSSASVPTEEIVHFSDSGK